MATHHEPYRRRRGSVTVHCNLHGCGNWNSNYALFELDSSVGGDIVSYSPTLSSLDIEHAGGRPIAFSPQAFTAGTIKYLDIECDNDQWFSKRSEHQLGNLFAAAVCRCSALRDSHTCTWYRS